MNGVRLNSSLFSCNFITRGNSTMKEKNSYAKTCLVDFPPGNSHISEEGGGDSTI